MLILICGKIFEKRLWKCLVLVFYLLCQRDFSGFGWKINSTSKQVSSGPCQTLLSLIQLFYLLLYYLTPFSYVMHCAFWYHLRNFKNVKNTHGGVLILIKLQACANGTKSRNASHIREIKIFWESWLAELLPNKQNNRK